MSTGVSVRLKLREERREKGDKGLQAPFGERLTTLAETLRVTWVLAAVVALQLREFMSSIL